MEELIQKCVDELQKEDADISFVKGILTTIKVMFPGMTSRMNGADISIAKTSGVEIGLGAHSRIGIHPAQMQEEQELSPAEVAAQSAMEMASGGVKPANISVIETNRVLNERGS